MTSPVLLKSCATNSFREHDPVSDPTTTRQVVMLAGDGVGIEVMVEVKRVLAELKQ